MLKYFNWMNIEKLLADTILLGTFGQGWIYLGLKGVSFSYYYVSAVMDHEMGFFVQLYDSHIC